MDLETTLASGLSYFFCAAVAMVLVLIVVVVVTTACGSSSYCSAVVVLETTATVADATTDVSKLISLESFCLYRQKLFIFLHMKSYIFLTLVFGRKYDSF